MIATLSSVTPRQLRSLDHRRRQLGMSLATLARHSHLSLPTVQRILSGKNPNAAWANVAAIAHSLGLSISLLPTRSAQSLRKAQAQRKARHLVQMVQGTSALEGQALDRVHLDRMRRQTARQLLGGPARRLWAE